MFENILGQNVSSQLISDIKAQILAPSMLFQGPPSSGKGTAALELARVISCESDSECAAWNCSCSACSKQRLLVHPDLLCLGSRPFSAEIAASGEALLRDGSVSARLLYIRSVRKLLSRFNPVLWEDEPRGAKISPLVSSIDEELNEFEFLTANFTEQASETKIIMEQKSMEKFTSGLLKNAYKLEAEGISDNISIGQLRRAASWSRLAPLGRAKLIVMENADRMQDEARNSLLKILEEPPERVKLVLCSSRPGSIIPTILSRLRVYRFVQRDSKDEDDVIRRVFKDSVKDLRINEYLDTFLPVSGETLYGLAAFFAASTVHNAVSIAGKQGRPVSEEMLSLAKSSALKAEHAGYGRPETMAAGLVNTILEEAEKFEIRSLFSRFLGLVLEHVSGNPVPAHNEVWKKNILWADTAVSLYRIRPAQALEKLFSDLSRGLAQL